MNENWVTICGRAVADPILRITATGPVTSFRLASSSSRLGDDGLWRDGPTSFYDISCWNKVGENVADSVHQGQPLIVHGRLTIREWENENGKGRSAEVKAAHVGHDMLFGTSKFLKVVRVTESADAADGRGDTEAVAQLTPASGGAGEVAA